MSEGRGSIHFLTLILTLTLTLDVMIAILKLRNRVTDFGLVQGCVHLSKGRDKPPFVSRNGRSGRNGTQRFPAARETPW
jgi:hypothetical protein